MSLFARAALGLAALAFGHAQAWRKTAIAARAPSPRAAATSWLRASRQLAPAPPPAAPAPAALPDVFINGKPAAVQGDKTGRGGSIVSGASGVFINGKPMARVGDAAGCQGK